MIHATIWTVELNLKVTVVTYIQLKYHKMKNLVYLLVGMLILSINTSCYDSSLDQKISIDEPKEPTRIISSSFSIKIVDQDQNAVSGATILHEHQNTRPNG